jgi:folate-binding Fe-S cluster repair protein YgfZ
MKYLGKLKQRMYLGHIDVDRPPRPGTTAYAESFGDQSAGTVVAAEKSPTGGVDLLCVAQISAAADDILYIDTTESGKVAITIRPLPYDAALAAETTGK